MEFIFQNAKPWWGTLVERAKMANTDSRLTGPATSALAALQAVCKVGCKWDGCEEGHDQLKRGIQH